MRRYPSNDVEESTGGRGELERVLILILHPLSRTAPLYSLVWLRLLCIHNTCGGTPFANSHSSRQSCLRPLSRSRTHIHPRYHGYALCLRRCVKSWIRRLSRRMRAFILAVRSSTRISIACSHSSSLSCSRPGNLSLLKRVAISPNRYSSPCLRAQWKCSTCGVKCNCTHMQPCSHVCPPSRLLLSCVTTSLHWHTLVRDSVLGAYTTRASVLPEIDGNRKHARTAPCNGSSLLTSLNTRKRKLIKFRY